MNGHKVFIVKGGAAEARSVEVGIRTNREVEIRSGISAQDTIVTTGILQIKPGSKLDVSVGGSSS